MSGILLGDISSGIASGITSGVVIAVLAVMMEKARRGRPKAEEGTGRLIFRQNPLVVAVGVLSCVLVPIAITVLLFFVPMRKQEDLIAVIFLYAMFVGMGAPLLWDALKFALIVGPDGIDCHSPWKGKFFIPWDKVDRVSFNPVLSWFVIRAKSGRTIHASTFVSGLNDLFEIFEEHLTPKQLEKAKSGYRMLKRDFPE